jgi:hypothetical protein
VRRAAQHARGVSNAAADFAQFWRIDLHGQGLRGMVMAACAPRTREPDDPV